MHYHYAIPACSDGGANAIAFKGRQSFFYQIYFPESPLGDCSSEHQKHHYEKWHSKKICARGKSSECADGYAETGFQFG